MAADLAAIWKIKIQKMKAKFIEMIPVIPSQDIERDRLWYKEKVGFETHFYDLMYAVLYRDNLVLHLQWHADNESDPLLGGSVVRIRVKNIKPLLDEFVERGTVKPESFKPNTPWRTHEFGFFDLNKNLIFVMEDV